jgi:predicted methyltransferase
MQQGFADEAYAAFFRALKPGGILGVEGHRGRADRPQDPRAGDGYIREDHAIALAQRAGFELVATSEALANPRDTKDHPAGVWTLPPTLRLGEKDRAKYVAIGESDKFLLKFRKPVR